MKTLTLKEGTIYTSIVNPTYFPEYEYAILRLMSYGSTVPILVCPVMLFKDTDDGCLLIRPTSKEHDNFFWKALFQRDLAFNEAFSIKASYTIQDGYVE